MPKNNKELGCSPIDKAKKTTLAISIASVLLAGGAAFLGETAWDNKFKEMTNLAKNGGTNKIIHQELKEIVNIDIDKLNIIDNYDSSYYQKSQDLKTIGIFEGFDMAYFTKIDETAPSNEGLFGFVAAHLSDQAVKQHKIKGPELSYRNGQLHYYIAKPIFNPDGNVIGSVVVAKSADYILSSLDSLLKVNSGKNIIIQQEVNKVIIPLVSQGSIPEDKSQISRFNDSWTINVWNEVSLANALPELLMSILPHAGGGLMIILGGLFANRRIRVKSLKDMELYLAAIEEERLEIERMANEVPGEVNKYDLEKERMANEIKTKAVETKATELDDAIAELDINKFDLTMLIPNDMINNSKVSNSEIHNLTTQHSYIIGHALGTMATRANKPAVIAHDGRAGCDEMALTMITGIRESGCDVVYLKDSNMPLLWSATDKYNAYISIMIGSDNDDVSNMDIRIGINGELATRKEVISINDIILKKDFTKGDGKLSHDSPAPNYIEETKNDVIIDSDLKIAVEASHNSVSSFVMDLYREYGCEVHCTGGEIGTINQEQGIEANYLATLGTLIRKKNLDVGFAYDRDADRIRVIDDEGQVIPGPVLSSLLAKHILEEQPGSSIVMDIEAGLFVESQIRKHYGSVIYSSSHLDDICRIGKEADSPFGLNYDGKYNYRDRWHGRADGVYVTSRILEIISMTGQKLSEMTAEIEKEYSYYKTFNRLLRIDNAQGVFLLLRESKSPYRMQCVDNILMIDFGRASARIVLRDRYQLDLEVHAWSDGDLESGKAMLQNFIKERKSDILIKL